VSRRILDPPPIGWTGLVERRAHLESGGTTVHAAAYSLDEVAVRVVRLSPPRPLLEWSLANGIAHAITGGFFTKPDCIPLGHLWVDGRSVEYQPFSSEWDARRAALFVDGDEIAIGRRSELPSEPRGDLLQAGPLLVADGRVVVAKEDPEGLSSESHLFDQDFTKGRLPRAAVGLVEHYFITLAADGRLEDEAGLTLQELAEIFVELGARSALNLDGGTSAALIAEGAIRNTPREDDGSEVAEGGPVPTAIAILPH
jgi:exopolysaccharide biosynthesis protein